MFQPTFDTFTAQQPLLPDIRTPALSDGSERSRGLRVVSAGEDSAPPPGGTLLLNTASTGSHDLEPVELGQPFLPGVSSITIAQALVCEQVLLETQYAPTAEESGAALLASSDFREMKNVHLKAERVRLTTVPADEGAISRRLAWMWHAGVNSPDFDQASRAAEAIDVMIDQVAPRGQLDLGLLAEDLILLGDAHPDIVAALLRGDLDDVPDLIDQAVRTGAREAELVEAAAWMFVCWAALEQQREACLGWRLIHKRLDDVWGCQPARSWTIGQLFGPENERHTFAVEMRQLYYDNIEQGLDRVADKRTINRIERSLRKFSLGGINRARENEVISLFGKGRLASIPTLLRHCSHEAGAYVRCYRALMTGSDGKSRAGRRADMLTARIPATQRTAIVCARICHLGALATRARMTDSLHAMLDAHLPEVLKPSAGKHPRPDKLRLRQLFHAVRIEFLRDGEHLPKNWKSVTDCQTELLPLELSREGNRRGHELFDACWAQLNNQPPNWRFTTSFGWECHGLPRTRLRAAP